MNILNYFYIAKLVYTINKNFNLRSVAAVVGSAAAAAAEK